MVLVGPPPVLGVRRRHDAVERFAECGSVNKAQTNDVLVEDVRALHALLDVLERAVQLIERLVRFAEHLALAQQVLVDLERVGAEELEVKETHVLVGCWLLVVGGLVGWLLVGW